MESNHAFFPDSIVILKLFLVALDDCIVECIVLLVLPLISFLIFLFVVYEQFVDFIFQQERDSYQILP